MICLKHTTGLLVDGMFADNARDWSKQRPILQEVVGRGEDRDLPDGRAILLSG